MLLPRVTRPQAGRWTRCAVQPNANLRPWRQRVLGRTGTDAFPKRSVAN